MAGTAALVTGASSGIGAATARALAAQGAAVALLARRADRLQQVKAEIESAGGTALAVPADVTDADRSRRGGAAGRRRAGTARHRGEQRRADADRRPLPKRHCRIGTTWCAVNVQGVLYVTRAAVPHLIDAAANSPRGVADLVTISSTAGWVARPNTAVYSLTKFGVNAFSEGIRQELLGKRVRVGVVGPGTVDTEISDHLSPESREAFDRQTADMVKLAARRHRRRGAVHRHPRPQSGRQPHVGPRRRTDLVIDADDRWVTGDHFGLPIPADPAALRAGGTTFLTQAFRAAGALTADNAVTRISRFDEVPGGSTGRKLLLRVEYDKPDAHAHTDLFVKFSRDVDNPIRDRGKTQMESEVLFASLSGAPGFPITVPATQFADYHRDTGTGILITERIHFAANGIERQYHKCLDYEMPEPLDHYRALLTALARLVGHHRSGCLPADLVSQFPVDLQAATVGEQASISADKLDRRLSRLAEFAHTSPALLPANVRSPQFLARLRNDAPRFLQHEPAVWSYLAAQTDYIALCHWNANVDNAWFWRDADNDVHCGLLDWGCVGQMNVAMALWGAMSGAETDMWDRHLDDLLRLFVAEIRERGGPDLDVNELHHQLMLYVGIMAVAWLLDVPALIRSRFGDAARSLSRKDPLDQG